MPDDTSLDYQSTIRESVRTPVSGLLVLVLLLGGLLACALTLIAAGQRREPRLAVAAVMGGVFILVMLGGMFVVNPNEAKVPVLFGRYVGTVRQAGMYWANPFYKKANVSLRIWCRWWRWRSRVGRRMV